MLSDEALNQINEKDYDSEIHSEGIADIIKYGVVFSRKSKDTNGIK